MTNRNKKYDEAKRADGQTRVAVYVRNEHINDLKEAAENSVKHHRWTMPPGLENIQIAEAEIERLKTVIGEQAAEISELKAALNVKDKQLKAVNERAKYYQRKALDLNYVKELTTYIAKYGSKKIGHNNTKNPMPLQSISKKTITP